VSETFPAIGHRYLVDFQGRSRVQLYFESETSLTYTSITNTSEPGMKFSKYHGRMTLIS
jgi:hypothetical protein